MSFILDNCSSFGDVVDFALVAQEIRVLNTTLSDGDLLYIVIFSIIMFH